MPESIAAGQAAYIQAHSAHYEPKAYQEKPDREDQVESA